MKRRAPGVRAYAIALLVLGLVTLAGLGMHMLDRLHAIELAQQREGEAAARLEFERAIENTLAQAASLAEQIASWDEARKQLAMPTCYTYWRDNRATAQGLWPAYMRGLELYDRGGALLSSFKAMLPANLPEGRAGMLVVNQGNLCLAQFAGVREDGGRGEPIGYVGLRVDLLNALRTVHRFTYLDADSLALRAGVSGMHDPSEAQDMIEFKPRQAAWVSILPDLVRQTLLQLMLAFLILVALNYLLVTRLFARPLRLLRDELAGLRQGRPSVEGGRELIPVHELIEVRQALHDYRRSLEQAHDALDRSNARLWAEAHVDALTGAFNRSAFDEDWGACCPQGGDEPLALMLLDCDFFKVINDSYGHETGDRVLQEVARLAQGELRREDRLYRLGGDEFIAILWGAGEAQALQVAERCRVAIGAYDVDRLGMRERLRVSIGIAASEHSCEGYVELLKQADLAMYHAKRGVGEQKVVLFHEALGHGMGECSSRVVETVLESVTSGKGIAMHYQPIVHAASGRPAYYEALLRIEDAEGVIGPADILPVAQRRGLQGRLDLAVLRGVIADLRAGRIPEGSGVSINFDGETIAEPEIMVEIESLSRFVQSHKIVLEITETTLISRFEYMTHALGRFRAMGLLVALDDFGSGYSSLRYLARMPVDIVKLDRSLIEVYGQDRAQRGMVVHVIDMLRDGGFDVVAEGIETEAQRQDFERLGVSHMQGWAFGRPERPIRA